MRIDKNNLWISAAIGGLVMWCCALPLGAATIAWTNDASVSGNFTDGTKWLGGVAPASPISTDFILFTNAASSAYTVTLTQNQTVMGTTVRTDRVTFDLNGFTFTNYISRVAPTAGNVATVTYTNSSATLAIVRMTNDTIVGGGGSGTLVFSGDNIRLNYRNVSGSVRNLIGSGGTLKILDGATVDTTDGVGAGSPSIEGGGTVIADGVGSTFIVRNSTVGTGPAGLSTIVLANGATQLWNGTINLGGAAANSARLMISNNAAFNGIPLGGVVNVARVASSRISTVDVRNASSFQAADMYLGGDADVAGGTAVVTIGDGSKLQSTGWLKIWGAATLNLTGTVTSLAGLSHSADQLTNHGTLNMNNATATFSSTRNFNGGTLNLADNAIATFSAILINTGTIKVATSSQLTTSSILSNSGNIAISNGGVLGANIIVNTGTLLLNNSVATVSGLVTNSGSLSFVNARVTFQSRVYNSGTNTMLNSVGTFNAGVINAGRWLTDPTTNVFQGFGLTNTISGGITMAAGDVYVFTNTQAGTASKFVNLSTNNLANNTAAGKMLFSGGLGLTQTFYAAGHDLGPDPGTPLLTATNNLVAGSSFLGYANNFALGTLEISNFSTVRVSDAFLGLSGLGANDSLLAGLYLENLFLGANSLLIIDTNVQVYFKNSNNWSLANIRLLNNQGIGGDAFTYDNTISGLHQLTIVPEPSVLLLWLGGAGTLWASRRRRRK